MADAEDDGATASPGVWIGLTVIAAVSFYFQAALTEERFVPALNVIAIEFNIPDDVAGATLMAAGASSPELFSSIVSLFITHSALGLGTIVGSEIFNQVSEMHQYIMALCVCSCRLIASHRPLHSSLSVPERSMPRKVEH
jgi:Ca2+/Na+ antiporter